MGTSVVGKSLLAALFCLTVGCACNRPAEYYAMQDRDRYAEPSEEEAQPSQEPQEPSGEPEASADASPDPVQERFRAKEYKYLELTGFYWLPEDCGTTSALIGRVAAYLNDNALSFNWIPYFHAEGYAQWKTYGFNFAYYQPNYFFYEVDASRVDQACKEAAEYGLSMEMEFDEDALVAGGKGDRLRSYMDGFRKYGAWEKQNMAYYQGGWAVKALKDSDVSEDNDLYHEFCEFVISRPIRETH